MRIWLCIGNCRWTCRIPPAVAASLCALSMLLTYTSHLPYRDVFPVHLQWTQDSQHQHTEKSVVCPITDLRSSLHPFAAIYPCGHVYSMRAVQQVSCRLVRDLAAQPCNPLQSIHKQATSHSSMALSWLDVQEIAMPLDSHLRSAHSQISLSKSEGSRTLGTAHVCISRCVLLLVANASGIDQHGHKDVWAGTEATHTT